MHRFQPSDRGYEPKILQKITLSQPVEPQRDLGRVSYLRATSEQDSYPASPEMTESWKDPDFSPSTIRHPFQVASTYTYNPVVTSPTSVSSDVTRTSKPPTEVTSMDPILERSQGPDRAQLSQNRPRSLAFRRTHTPVSFSRHSRGEYSLRNTLTLLAPFVPAPPLLSLLYLVTGHGILRSSSDSTSLTNTTPLIYSVKIGVIGGAILALPLTIVLYLLLFPTQNHSDTADEIPLDFFDDNDSRHNGIQSFLSYLSCSELDFRTKWRSMLGFVGVMVIVVFVGTISGPLGVTCLSANGPSLTASEAAKAGTIGGLVLSPVIVGVSVVTLVFLRMRKLGESEELAHTGAIPTSGPTIQ
ncbi:hypothetical protein Moror_3091 [Moniliophthora roreri MCA 2997]|uniref:Uncharacterized protein n=2 Tax=Moniliophthora roreri TaxID=221103 RepID=V2X787_MONRO|nr:hypothetical protein Moror_3091 [Moniliophthora roreri MCA 2997]KAI3605829.1 hypothetical protein WG66_012390 [Moniliophthora roreri]